jgi:hypothetical protein
VNALPYELPSRMAASKAVHRDLSTAEMHIDPKRTIAGYPTLLVRRALRQLDLYVEWNLGRSEAITGEGRAFAKALAAAGLVDPTRKGYWSITRTGKAL